MIVVGAANGNRVVARPAFSPPCDRRRAGAAGRFWSFGRCAIFAGLGAWTLGALGSFVLSAAGLRDFFPLAFFTSASFLVDFSGVQGVWRRRRARWSPMGHGEPAGLSERYGYGRRVAARLPKQVSCNFGRSE